MTKPIERAARAINGGVRIENRRAYARAAITAYLDPEDEKMVERVRAHIIKSIWPDNFSAETCARAAIAALREMSTQAKE